jgi:hypothetical protein
VTGRQVTADRHCDNADFPGELFDVNLRLPLAQAVIAFNDWACHFV